MKRFKARLASRGPGGAWTFLEIPFGVDKASGSKGRVAVAGTMNGFAYRNSLLPQGDGTHAMAVNKALQAGANARAGDLVAVTMEVDRSERIVVIPPELRQALASHSKAETVFQSLSYSHRQEFAEWVASAKQEQTRRRRAEKSIPLVLERQHVR
jgi:hypothetical protein